MKVLLINKKANIAVVGNGIGHCVKQQTVIRDVAKVEVIDDVTEPGGSYNLLSKADVILASVYGVQEVWERWM